MAAVIALIHGEPGAYGISFPDFQGCISGGSTIEEAFRRGRETLAFHIEGMEAVGESLPKLRGVAEIRLDPEFAEELKDAVLGVVDIDLPAHPVRINISIDDRLLERADRAADAAGETRSGYIATALKGRLAEATGNMSMLAVKKFKRKSAKKVTAKKRVVQTRRKSAVRKKPAAQRRRR